MHPKTKDTTNNQSRRNTRCMRSQHPCAVLKLFVSVMRFSSWRAIAQRRPVFGRREEGDGFGGGVVDVVVGIVEE